MSIESDLKRLADAAEGILAHLTGTEIAKRGPGRPPKEDKKADPAPAGEPATSAAASTQTTTAAASASAASNAPTVEAVRERVKKILGSGQKEALMAIVKACGGESASTIPEGNRAKFLAETEDLLAAA